MGPKHDQRNRPDEAWHDLTHRKLCSAAPGLHWFFCWRFSAVAEFFFVNSFFSRIDKNRLNSTLGIPETLQVEKF